MKMIPLLNSLRVICLTLTTTVLPHYKIHPVRKRSILTSIFQQNCEKQTTKMLGRYKMLSERALLCGAKTAPLICLMHHFIHKRVSITRTTCSRWKPLRDPSINFLANINVRLINRNLLFPPPRTTSNSSDTDDSSLYRSRHFQTCPRVIFERACNKLSVKTSVLWIKWVCNKMGNISCN